MRLTITGGGTGGHIFSGVAIAQEFLQQSKANQVLFIGSEYGLETKLVPKAGYKLETLRLGKLVGQTLLTKLATLFWLPFAVLKSIRVLRQFKADMVIGVGGYAAGPCIVAAKILGIPIGVLEQNSVMGFTNQISSKLAHHVFTAFNQVPEGASAIKCVYTGNPARSTMKPSTAAKPTAPFMIFAFGGSQGATGINKMLTEAAKEFLPFKDQIEIVHQTGPKDLEWVKKAYQELGFEAQVFAFIDDMQSYYNKASVVVCRAGSGTISELAATKNAAIFVPFPFAAGNHQEVNARVIERAQAAVVLVQGKNTGLDLARELLRLKSNPAALELMRENMTAFYRPDAASRIVEIMKIHTLKSGK